MSEGTVEARHENGLLLLRLHYGSDLMAEAGSGPRLGSQLVEAYREKRGDSLSCIVEIDADVAGSPVVRALFDLWEVVVTTGGKVACVGYPADYIDSLTSLGLPSLEGFLLASSLEDARSRLGG